MYLLVRVFLKPVTAIQINRCLEASTSLAAWVSAGKRIAREAFQAHVWVELRCSPLFHSRQLFHLARGSYSMQGKMRWPRASSYFNSQCAGYQ